MADLDVIEPIPSLDPIVAIGKDELVEGGLEGAANRPIIALANQVAYVIERTYSKTDVDDLVAQLEEMISAAEKGVLYYQTQAELLATTLPQENRAGQARDTGKLYLWKIKSAAGVTPVVWGWVDTGQSDLEKAQADATAKANAALQAAKNHSDEKKLDLSVISYEYIGGNILGPKTPKKLNYGLTGSLSPHSSVYYDACCVEVYEGDALYILNNLEDYSPATGAGFAFFSEDPLLNVSAIRVSDNRILNIADDETGVKYARATVPVGAKYLMLNTRFYSSNGLTKNDYVWSIRKGSFLNSYEPGQEFLKKINGALVPTGEDVDKKIENMLDKNFSIEESYLGGNIVANIGEHVEFMGITSALSITRASYYDSVVLSVSPGVSLCLFNDLGVISISEGAGFAFFAEDPREISGQSRIVDNRATAVDTETSIQYQKVTVPDGAGFLVINTRFYNSAGTIKNKFIWAVHEGRFVNSFDPGNKQIKKINGAIVSGVDIKTEKKGGNIVENIGVVMPSRGLNASLNIVVATSYDSVYFPVVEGVDLYIFNDLQKYSASLGAGFAFFAEDPSLSTSITKINDNRLQLADAETNISYQKVTVPVGAKYLMLNTRFYNSAGTIRDIFIWAVHEGRFVNSYAEGEIFVTAINSLPLSGGGAGGDGESSLYFLDQSITRFNKKKVFCFGDSITQGTEGGYVKYISQALNCDLYNYGSSGAAARRLVDIVTAGAGIPRRDSNTESTNWPIKDFTQCSAVTIQIGTNDYVSGSIDDIPTTQITDYENPLDFWALFPSNYVANIALCIEFIKNQNQDCEIFLITPPYRNTAGDVPSRITNILPYLRAVAEYYSILLINTLFESGIGFKYMAPNVKYSYDGVHFNALGNKLWGRYIAKKMIGGGS